MVRRRSRVSVRFLAGALVVAIAAATGCASTGTGPAPSASSASSGITGAVAVERAREVLSQENKGDWKVAFLSNTGIAQQITTVDSPEIGLMNSSGAAGQWIVEFYRDEPKPVTEGDQKGFSYPFASVTVTDQEPAFREYEGGLGVPSALAPLPEEDISALAAAFTRAKGSLDTAYDRASAASDVRSDGSVTWRFRFYDLGTGEIVAKVAVTGDGSRVVPWE